MIFLAEKTFCANTANIWYIVGIVVNVVRILIPIILIVLGMIDMGKATISNEEKAMNKAAAALMKKAIAGVVMFIIPTVISTIFNLLLSIELTSGDTNICMQCLTNVYGGVISTKEKEHSWSTINENGGFEKIEELPAILCNLEDLIQKKQ